MSKYNGNAFRLDGGNDGRANSAATSTSSPSGWAATSASSAESLLSIYNPASR